MIHAITPQIDRAIHQRLQPGQDCKICEWLKAVHINPADVYLVLIDDERGVATVGRYAPCEEWLSSDPSTHIQEPVKLHPVVVPYYEASLN